MICCLKGNDGDLLRQVVIFFVILYKNVKKTHDNVVKIYKLFLIKQLNILNLRLNRKL